MNKSIILNPMSMGSPAELADMFALMAEVSLSDEQRNATIQIIERLPVGATVRAFVEVSHVTTARQLGISLELLEGIRPLLIALEEASRG